MSASSIRLQQLDRLENEVDVNSEIKIKGKMIVKKYHIRAKICSWILVN